MYIFDKSENMKTSNSCQRLIQSDSKPKFLIKFVTR